MRDRLRISFLGNRAWVLTDQSKASQQCSFRDSLNIRTGRLLADLVRQSPPDKYLLLPGSRFRIRIDRFSCSCSSNRGKSTVVGYSPNATNKRTDNMPYSQTKGSSKEGSAVRVSREWREDKGCL